MKKDNKKNFFLKNYQKDSKKKEKVSFIKLENNDIKIEKKNKHQKPDRKLISIFLYLIGLDNAVNIIKNFNENEIETLLIELLKIDKITDDDIKNIKEKIGKIDNISNNSTDLSEKKNF